MIKKYGGVGEFFFFRKGVKYEEMKYIVINLECIVFYKDDFGLIIVIIFRLENVFLFICKCLCCIVF